MQGSRDISPKSYGTAVALCGVFGVMGIHHFYLGDWLHGLVDLGLLVATVALFAAGSPLAFLFLLVDAVHTIVVFSMLIIGRWRDGEGRPIPIPSFNEGH